MKVAALPRIYMKRCPKMACKSPVTSHSRLFIPTFKLQGSGVICSIPTLNHKSIATKKDSVKRVFFVACYWLFGWEPERSGKFQTSAALLIFMRRTTISHF